MFHTPLIPFHFKKADYESTIGRFLTSSYNPSVTLTTFRNITHRLN